MGLPGSRLTPESRFHETNWHRVSDADIDKELDFLLSKDLMQQQAQVEETFYPSYHSTNFGASLAIMADGDSSESTVTAAVAPREGTEENVKPSHSESRDSPPSYHSNEFDNPEFHKSDEHDNEVRVGQAALPESSIETKQEFAPTAVMTTSASADHQITYPGINGIYSSSPMQRVFSEPINHSITNWQSEDSDGPPVSHSTHNPTSGVHQAHFAPWNKLRSSNHGFDNRSRAQTYNTGPTSHPRQLGASSVPSSKRAVVAWDHMEPTSTRFGSVAKVGTLSNSLAHNAGGEHDDYVAGYDVDTHYPMLGPNQAGGTVNSLRINKDSFQHNDIYDPLSANFYPDLRMIQQQEVLKSHPLPTSSNGRHNANSTRSESRGPMRTHSHQDAMRAQFHPDHMEERQGRSKSPLVELVYNDIESARQAERPKFKTNPKKDPTIPLTDKDRQRYVERMVLCMKNTHHAQDNAGMINQWEKLRQDQPRMEQAAWRLLDMCLQIHIEGMPLLPNRPSCNRYASMLERWDAICRGMSTQKTMCKHLLGSEFAAQLVNDPATATQRVQNNRKVNAGKKSYLDKGRRAVHGGPARSARHGSSASTQRRAEDSDEEGHPYGDLHDGNGLAPFLGEMGDEDAEGELDEEYLNPTANASADRVLPTSQGTTPARRPKRELEHDDSDDEYGSRAKKPRRSTAKTYPTAPKRHIKNPRRPGDRSKFQVVNGKMIELEDKKNEELVYAHASAHVRELYNKIHYPNGRPSSRNGRPVNGHANGHASSASGYHPGAQAFFASNLRQHPRKAACKSFVGQDETSTDGDDLFSDPKIEEAAEYHSNSGPQQA
ncbi:MAG: hypothetical protein L6R36_000810 [Xanthoria steineri]|nr:MAG: hypothetical protein L6R36_000810 [Xanthoria steineri]